MNLTQERLKELLHYDPETGIFVWLVSPNSRVQAGEVAGGPASCGYWRIRVCGARHSAHRLAWFWMTGAWPLFEIDHRNGIGTDNRWKNLRDGTRSFNIQNQRRARSDNKTGFLGVHRSGKKERKGFVAKIQLDGKQRYLGVFSTAEAAHAAYLAAKRRIHPGCVI